MSYATIQQADEYISTRYTSTNPVRIEWEALSDEDKQVHLNVSFEIIESLPFTGRPTDINQENAFPRNGDKDVPVYVAYAQIELGFSLSDTAMTERYSEYARMYSLGINSYSIGSFSESFTTATGGASWQLGYGLVSDKAEKYLQPWLTGGYCIV